MKHLYTVLAAALAFAAPMTYAEEGTGVMIFQTDQSVGQAPEPELNDEDPVDVTATFADGVLTISNLPFDLYDLPLTVNLQTGEVASAKDVEADVFVDEEEPDYSFTYYYFDFATSSAQVCGKIVNMGEKSVLTLNPFGPGLDYTEIMEMIFFNILFYNTEITLNFAIPGLEVSVEEPEVTIGEVTHKVVPNDYGVTNEFTVPVTTKNVADDVELALFAKGPNNDDYVKSTDHTDGVFTVVLGGVEPDKEHTLSLYATAGNAKSETKEVKFTVSTTGIATIVVEGAEAPKYFNLRGIEVAQPQTGNVYIRVEGDKASKVRF